MSNEIIKKVLDDIDSLLSDLNELSHLVSGFDLFEGYSVEVTWVKNKIGKKYYYVYLKSKSRHPKSIYLGKTGSDLAIVKEISILEKKILNKINTVKEEAKRLNQLLKRYGELIQLLAIKLNELQFKINKVEKKIKIN